MNILMGLRKLAAMESSRYWTMMDTLNQLSQGRNVNWDDVQSTLSVLPPQTFGDNLPKQTVDSIQEMWENFGKKNTGMDEQKYLNEFKEMFRNMRPYRYPIQDILQARSENNISDAVEKLRGKLYSDPSLLTSIRNTIPQLFQGVAGAHPESVDFAHPYSKKDSFQDLLNRLF